MIVSGPSLEVVISTVITDPLPLLILASWSHSLEGQVERLRTLSYEQLQALPARTLVAVTAIQYTF
jgi:DMSO/TMAO reductase YedYZ molybdopterin-dependent catalytic subunit